MTDLENLLIRSENSKKVPKLKSKKKTSSLRQLVWTFTIWSEANLKQVPVWNWWSKVNRKKSRRQKTRTARTCSSEIKEKEPEEKQDTTLTTRMFSITVRKLDGTKMESCSDQRLMIHQINLNFINWTYRPPFTESGLKYISYFIFKFIFSRQLGLLITSCCVIQKNEDLWL